MIRTHEAGTLRPAQAGEHVTAGGLGRAPPRPRRRGLHRPARRQRRGPGRVPRRGRGPARACAARRVLHPGDGEVAAAADRQREPGTAHRRGGGGRRRAGRAGGAVRGRTAAVPGRGRRGAERGRPAALPLPGHPAGGDGRGLRIRSEATYLASEVLRAHGFVYVETPVPDPVHPGGRTRLPGARSGCGRAAGTRCRSPRSCSSSCSWSAGWSATTRSRAASATRTSAPTGSRSSPRSTSEMSFVDPGGRHRRSPRTWSGGCGPTWSATGCPGRSRG